MKRLTREQRNKTKLTVNISPKNPRILYFDDNDEVIVVDKNPHSYVSAGEGQECNGYIKHKGKWILMKPSKPGQVNDNQIKSGDIE